MRYQLWSDTAQIRARHEGRLLLPRQPCGCSASRRSRTPGRCAATQGVMHNRMGLSVGWGDDYPANFAFQWIDISALAPGDYIGPGAGGRAELVRRIGRERTTAHGPGSRIAEHPTGRSPSMPSGRDVRGAARLDGPRRAPVRHEPVRDLSGGLGGCVRARRAGRVRGDRPQLPRRAGRRRAAGPPGRPDHPRRARTRCRRSP